MNRIFFLLIATAIKTNSWAETPIKPTNWGQENILAAQAWGITQGSSKIVVAIIDTGIDKTHPDLQKNLWINAGETGIDSQGLNKSSNGIDDDHNGYIDDIHGWNFAANNSDISDQHGHGTHIAGLIGANGHSRQNSFRGMAPDIRIMTLKYYDPQATGSNISSIVRAIKYAVKMKAQIINFSGGGLNPNFEEEQAIREAQKQNILFVAAAGNEKANSDFKAYYPANYGLSNIISVTATNPLGEILPSSNYGIHTVDIAAPGENLLSTLPHGKWGFMTGTSQATAMVTGVAALLMSLHPEWSNPEKIISQLVRTGDRDAHLKGKTKYRAKLNAYQALSMSDVD